MVLLEGSRPSAAAPEVAPGDAGRAGAGAVCHHFTIHLRKSFPLPARCGAGDPLAPRRSIVILTLAAVALATLPTIPLAEATHDLTWSAVFTPFASTSTACRVHVLAKHTATSVGVVFEVVSRGTCPFVPVAADTCTGSGSVGAGYTATCTSGATLSTTGTGIFADTPSVLTSFTTWRYGLACPNPFPLCVTTSGQVNWNA